MNKFPYFASEENQSLYVMVPTVNATLLKEPSKNIGEIERLSSEEEILPDFKCKICSSRILTYSEFKDHQKNHKKSEEDSISEMYFPNAGQVQGIENTNCGLYFNLLENFKYDPIKQQIDHLKQDSHLGKTTQNRNLKFNKVLSSERASNQFLDSVKSKSNESLEMVNIRSEKKFKKPYLLKLPSIQLPNTHNAYVNTLNMDTDLYPTKGNFAVKAVLNNDKSLFNNKLYLSTNSRKEISNGNSNIPIAESSTLNTELILTNTDFKTLLTTSKRNKIIPVMKPNSAFSCCQSQLLKIFTETNTHPQESNIRKTEVNQTMGKLTRSFSSLQSLVEMSCSSPIYSENKMPVGDNIRDKTAEYEENRTLWQSVNAKDHNAPILELLTNFKEKDKLHTKENIEYKETFLDGMFSETICEKTTDQTMDKSGDTISTFQQLCNVNSPDVSTDSECEIYRNKNYKSKVDKDDNSTLKIGILQSVEGSDHDVYVLEPSTNSKEKPFRCFYCRKSFESCSHMRKHLLEHDETKTFFCVLCNSSFTRISSFREHLLIFHCQAKDERQCPYCNYRCFRTSNLEKHISEKHSRSYKSKTISSIKGFATL